MSSDPIRTEPWQKYLERQERRWREADMLVENERLREECHRLKFLYENLKADSNHCDDCCCARSWEALGITHYTGKPIWEHIAELQSRVDSLTERLCNAQADFELAWADCLDRQSG